MIADVSGSSPETEILTHALKKDTAESTLCTYTGLVLPPTIAVRHNPNDKTTYCLF